MFRFVSARTVAVLGAVGATMGATAQVLQHKQELPRWQPWVACDANSVASAQVVDSESKIIKHGDAHNSSHGGSQEVHHNKSSQAHVIEEAIKEQQRADGDVETAVDTVNNEEEDEWEQQKKHCSFCRHFIESPCKLAFKKWSICVENAKNDEKDFVSLCSQATSDLVECTSNYPEYFREAAEKSGDGDDEDSDGSLEADSK
jgi:hypothetical protein